MLQEPETYVTDGILASKPHTHVHTQGEGSCSQLTLEELLPGAGLGFRGPVFVFSEGTHLSSDVVLL